jgi:transposase
VIDNDPRGEENAAMNEQQRQITLLTAALEDARALAESRRLELVTMSRQLDELLRLAAMQNEQLSDLRTMMRRRMTKRQKGRGETSDSSDPEGDPAAANLGAPAPANTGAPDGENRVADTEHAEPVGGNAGTTPGGAAPPAKRRAERAKGTGRRPVPDHLESTTLEQEACACVHCGSRNVLSRDWNETRRLDAVATIAKIRHDVVEVVRCKDCGRTTTAPPPPLPCAKAKFTCGFLAWVVVMKFALLVPLDRMSRLLATQGIDVPEPTLVRLIELACDLAGPVDGEHWKQIKSTPCVLTDATGLKVLVKGLPEAWDAYLDVFNADKVAVYQFALTKHSDDLAAMFRGFGGVVMCDAESRLNEIFRIEGITRANCNAHPRRAFRDAEAVQPVLAKEGGRYLARMYAFERQALRDGLTGAALVARRQAVILPVVAEFKVWLDKHTELLPSDLLGKAVRYYIKHFEHLTRFLDDANVPIDNNPSERAFQDHAKLRLNSLFAGSAEGGRRWALLLGIVTTAKRNGLDVQAYLTWMFERRGTWRKRFGLSAAQLTPAAYRQMLEQQKGQVAAA